MAATDDDLAEARAAAREASYAGLRAALGGQPDVAPGPDVDADGAAPLLAEAERLRGERDRHWTHLRQTRAELADAIRERDEARAELAAMTYDEPDERDLDVRRHPMEATP